MFSQIALKIEHLFLLPKHLSFIFLGLYFLGQVFLLSLFIYLFLFLFF